MTSTPTPTTSWSELAGRLQQALHLATPPIFLAFGPAASGGLPPFTRPMSPDAPDGRHGRVPASCVYWIEAVEADEPFSTVAEDHGNCSVGLFTHGFAPLDTTKDDVGTLLASGWVTEEMVPQIPFVAGGTESIAYGRLDAVPDGVEPDVVMMRVNGRQLMVLSDAIPGLSIEGKPQCHIVALAKEHGVPAASVGCALSRARTGMRPEEMTCALPAGPLAELVAAIEQTAETDAAVARYAADDARRFAG